MIQVKICGITEAEDAMIALKSGYNGIGFIFTESPRRISLQKAQEIVKKLPPFVYKIGVFRDPIKENVKEVLKIIKLSAVQTYKDLNEDLGVEIIRAYILRDNFDFFSVGVDLYSYILLDFSKKFSTKTHMDIPYNYKIPFILGGGLTVENIFSVLNELYNRGIVPCGLDVCSGVEKFPGKKDPTKVKEFINRVRAFEKEKKI